jgi:hypothetical protein
MTQHSKDRTEYACAVVCVFAAITMGVTAMTISQTHDIGAGVLIFIAQLLLFAASVFHLNYKLMSYGETNQPKK